MESVIVAHGLWMPGAETFLLRRRLRAAGFDPRLFRYPTVGAGLDDNVARLERFVAASSEPRVNIVGYSLGGVLAARVGRGPSAARIGRIVCLGSPLNGSVAAARLARFGLGRRIVGKSMLDLIARGPARPWPGSPGLGIVAGRLALGAGLVLGGLDGPNDGTVQVSETALAGATAHIVLPVSHTTLLLSRAVAEQMIAFLKTGAFA